MSTNKVDRPTERDLGKSGTASLAEQFPATPTDFDPKEFIFALLDGTVGTGRTDGVPGTPPGVDGGIGLLVENFNMDYEGAPDLLDPIIQDDPGIVGLVPNPTPPGPGDVNPRNKPPPPSDYPPDSSGFGSSTSPSETSPNIADQRFDNLIPGKSSP